ncbi:MAG: NADH:ubiquinone reductase (Na(+)-transporting) subunit C [Gammaproteobacteria bacterium]|nr:NADH:ubiquinone reductase (Na(+)-transporting) subunit C [Gammaproteobacteria bacterium]MDH3536989.1 NADH:ubiquinone reductase (Na(+)-transporting) subunit C [Gammaproteobacteria bacterium]
MSESANRDSRLRPLGVTLSVAFVCALLVSVVAVTLRPTQKANIEAERIAQLELVLEALSAIGRAQSIENLEARIVKLESGVFDDSIDPARFDAERAASKPTSSAAIPGELDLAGLKRRAMHAQVYLVRAADKRIDLIILPVSGRGYQSTLRAWLVLDGDTRTVRALKFYQHGETPGVGARIEDPDWEAQWRDLPAYDDDGVLRIGVRVQAGGGTGLHASYQVDSISGATRTSQGVHGMLRFWLGEFGFGPFLQRLREEQL